MHNIQRRKPQRSPEYVSVDGMEIEVLPYNAAQNYLGRKLTFRCKDEADLDNRIALSWRKFHVLKQELTSRSYSLKGRLKLFHGTVTPTMLYGSASWNLTVDLRNKLRRTQRQMLRMILNSPR